MLEFLLTALVFFDALIKVYFFGKNVITNTWFKVDIALLSLLIFTLLLIYLIKSKTDEEIDLGLLAMRFGIQIFRLGVYIMK